MSDLRVVIRGLAFCRPLAATNMTQILFPHPPGHALSLTITRSHAGSPSEVIEDKLPRVNTLALTIENDTEIIPPFDSGGHPLGTDLVNIIQLHRDFALPGPRINFRPRRDVVIPMSFLTLPTNVLYADGNTPVHEFWMRKTRGGTSPERIYLKRKDGTSLDRPVPQEAVTHFRIPATAEGRPASSAKLQLKKPFNRSYTFEHEPNPNNPATAVNYKVVLNNHCEGETCGADFGYYYEMLEGRNGDGFNIEIEEFPQARPPLNVSPDSIAACNPVVGDPPEDLEHWYGG